MMQIYLFDRFDTRQNETAVRLQARKAQELLAYLLLHPNRYAVRELVASHLWGNTCTTAKSRAYLRKALWKLQTFLRNTLDDDGDSVIVADGNAVGIGNREPLWIDVDAFESTYVAVRGISASDLDGPWADRIQTAIDLYTGDLLAEWFSDWCVVPRARLKQMYIVLLDKLLAWAVTAGAYETGLDAARRILAVDRARERTHRQLMWLCAYTGRRSDALRQFDLCERALEEELGVAPGPRTIRLVQDIRAGEMPEPHIGTGAPPAPSTAGTTDVESKLDRLCERVADLEAQVQALVRTLQSERRKEERQGALD